MLDACPAEKLGFVVTGADREDGNHYGYGYTSPTERSGVAGSSRLHHRSREASAVLEGDRGE